MTDFNGLTGHHTWTNTNGSTCNVKVENKKYIFYVDGEIITKLVRYQSPSQAHANFNQSHLVEMSRTAPYLLVRKATDGKTLISRTNRFSHLKRASDFAHSPNVTNIILEQTYVYRFLFCHRCCYYYYYIKIKKEKSKNLLPEWSNIYARTFDIVRNMGEWDWDGVTVTLIWQSNSDLGESGYTLWGAIRPRNKPIVNIRPGVPTACAIFRL